jgi:hypothetical protein
MGVRLSMVEVDASIDRVSISERVVSVLKTTM